MTDIPAMMLWTDAYVADTTHLTTFEHGAYLLILIAMWRAGGSIPDNDDDLARYAKLTPGKWRKIAPRIRKFFTVEGDTVTQKRLMLEFQKALSKKTKIEFAGYLGGVAKSLKNKESVPSDATGPPIAKACLSEPEEYKKPPKGGKKNSADEGKNVRKFKHALLDDWNPDAVDREYRTKLGLSEKQFENSVEKMRLWAKANDIKKVDWHATLKGFLRGDAEKFGISANGHTVSAENLTASSTIFIKEDTPQWNAWAEFWKKTKGVSPPVLSHPETHERGWRFPTEWPPNSN